MVDEGYVKFSLSMTDGDVPKHPDWEKLNEARGSLHQLGLIGTYPNGIGFGNASMRNSGLEFIITGTATGGIPILKEDDYCLVQSFELEKNNGTERQAEPRHPRVHDSWSDLLGRRVNSLRTSFS